MASVDVVHVSDEAEQLEHDQNVAVIVDYGEFFKLPVVPPKDVAECKAICKLCYKTRKYTPTSKGNLQL